MSAPDARALMAKLREHLAWSEHAAGCKSITVASRDPDCAACLSIVEADAYLAATAPPEPIVYEPPALRKRAPQETGAAGAARSKVLRAVRATRAEAGRIGGRVSAAKRARVAGGLHGTSSPSKSQCPECGGSVSSNGVCNAVPIGPSNPRRHPNGKPMAATVTA